MHKCLGELCCKKRSTKLCRRRKTRRLIDFVPHWPLKSLHNSHFSLPFQVFWHRVCISLCIKKRSRCGETSKQDAMEITHCAEMHGLLEAPPPCFSRMFYKSFLQKCGTRVSLKSVPQERPTRVCHKGVKQVCPTGLPEKSVKQECFAKNVFWKGSSISCSFLCSVGIREFLKNAFGFVASIRCFFPVWF